MKKYNISVKAALAVFALALSACSSDNDIVDNEPNNQEKPVTVTNKTMTFSATMDSDDASDSKATRTVFNTNNTIWAEGDAISILNTASVPSDASLPDNGTFNIVAPDGGEYSKNCTFTGDKIKANGNDNDQFYAVYPSVSTSSKPSYVTGFSADANGVKMQAEIPTVQTAVRGSYDQRLHFMTAYSANSTFNFKNVCALLKITLSGTVSACRIKVVANPTLSTPDARDFGYTSIAGKFDASISTDGTTTVTATEEEKTYVELRAEGDDGTATTRIVNDTYYLAVLPVDIPNGFTIIIEGFSSGKPNGKIYQRVNTSLKKFERNKIYNLGSYNINQSSLLMNLENAVDLDLPSGTLWATKNINKTGSFQGDTKDDVYQDGDYLSFGKKDNYSSSNYTQPSLTSNTVRSSDDAAYSSQTSSRYCTPIYAQIYEFYNHFSDSYKNSFKKGFWIFNNQSYAGAQFTAPTGTERTIWFPYAGYKSGSSRYDYENKAHYWSRTFASNGKAYCLDLEQQSSPTVPITSQWTDDCYKGHSIRPVGVNAGIAPMY